MPLECFISDFIPAILLAQYLQHFYTASGKGDNVVYLLKKKKTMVKTGVSDRHGKFTIVPLLYVLVVRENDMLGYTFIKIINTRIHCLLVLFDVFPPVILPKDCKYTGL